MNNFLKKSVNNKIGFLFIISVFLIAVFLIWISYKNFEIKLSIPSISFKRIPFVSTPSEVKEIKKFSSLEDFKNYLKEIEQLQEYVEYHGFRTFTFLERGIGMSEAPSQLEKAALPERVSETTVQIPGIDEPDIVKTDGKEIYFSPGRTWPIWREEIPIIVGKTILPPYYKEPTIKIIKAFPPTDLAKEGEIEKSGDLLLIKEKSILLVFTQKEILGYDVSNPKEPKKKWEIKLDKNNSIVTSRLYKNKVYLVTKNIIDTFHPCPIKPLTVGETILEFQCQEIYHPVLPIPVDVTFLAMVLDPVSGQIENKVAFVGSSGQSVVYMSEKALYITYSYYENIIKFSFEFLKDKCQDLVPKWILEKLAKLESYDISQQAKILELETIFNKYLNSLDSDENLKIQNEIANRINDYYKEKKRDFEKSGIVKIDLEKLEIIANGNVPGYLLNQFSLDEFQENLRVAVTVGERSNWFRFLWFPRPESTNDVYVLDRNLKIIGQIKDLGLQERIYSARFIEDKGYLVTFRETDPFYILDLSNPQKPELKGELKIPGYSSYLHPITKDKILGIGKENWQVKISLFDVLNTEKPREIDKYILNENWSDILNTHHAFLLDEKHKIFFLPGNQGGYIFSYKNDKLELTKAISNISTRRAIYIDDYLYIISDKKITVLNEISWQKMNEIELSE